MDNNKGLFKFDANICRVLNLSYRISVHYQIECVTDLGCFLALTCLEDSPLYKRMIDRNVSKDSIYEIASKIAMKYVGLASVQKTSLTISFKELSMSFNISKQLELIFKKASDIAKEKYNKDFIGFKEFLEAVTKSMPAVYEDFIKMCLATLNQNPVNEEKEKNVEIPSALSGCLTILNSEFSPSETDCRILGRDKETLQLIRVLAKDTKRNAILVGEPGVGKTALIEKLTWMIVTGNCPAKFKDSIIVSLDINSIIAGTTLRGSAEARFEELRQFLNENPNCILFIDEVHNLLGAGACRDGDLDLANALKPILARGTTQVIGATTLDEYNRYFSRDGALKRRFEKIVVKQPKIHEVYPMIKNQIDRLAKSHDTSITKDVVEDIIFYASCFNKETKNPDRTLDLIDKAMATAELSGKRYVSREDVLDNFDLNYTIFEKTPSDIKTGLAYHEAGHYLVYRFSDELNNFNTIAVSIMPAEDYYGAHVCDIDEDIMPSRTLRYYIQLIGCKLAGRIAEEMYSKKLSAGASQDMNNATELAKHVITKYGLVETFSVNRVYLDEDKGLPLTREKILQIDNEVDYLLTKAQMYAKYILKHHNAELKLLVDALLSKGMMSADEIDQLLNPSKLFLPT